MRTPQPAPLPAHLTHDGDIDLLEFERHVASVAQQELERAAMLDQHGLLDLNVGLGFAQRVKALPEEGAQFRDGLDTQRAQHGRRVLHGARVGVQTRHVGEAPMQVGQRLHETVGHVGRAYGAAGGSR